MRPEAISGLAVPAAINWDIQAKSLSIIAIPNRIILFSLVTVVLEQTLQEISIALLY
ncbi:hypothetical protein COCNU_contig68744414G000010 [Cocos nucifera]|nr:hypothetical protein [Cocos nucifera]